MNKLYDSIEPVVIDEALIRAKCIVPPPTHKPSTASVLVPIAGFSLCFSLFFLAYYYRARPGQPQRHEAQPLPSPISSDITAQALSATYSKEVPFSVVQTLKFSFLGICECAHFLLKSF